MLFNSFAFLLFFPVVAVSFYLLPHRWRWLHLLVASCVFYMSFIPAYVLILFFTIAIDFTAGILIEAAHGRQRQLYLALSLAANLGVLAVFKYYNFFVDNINASLHLEAGSGALSLLSFVLPIGLSFHTFQAMSYTIEVYRGNYPAERHLGLFALYVLFFPQLVAGPIERPQHVLPQLHETQIFRYENVTSGLRLMAWGLFKKVVIADRLALLVNPVYNSPGDFRGLPLTVATVFFSLQIYCDFSGYSDMALGAARVLGFRLMQNFNRPYFASSIGEFWRRWHISLSTWFRDYLYIPLGGNRVALPRCYANVLIVFLASGLWHGANWTFLVWGALHGSYLLLEQMTRPLRRGLARQQGLGWLQHPGLGVLVTYCLVAFAWIFFRANTFADACYMVRHLADPAVSQRYGVVRHGLDTVFAFYAADEWLALGGAVGILWLVERAQARVAVGRWVARQVAPMRWALYYGIVGYIALLGAFETRQFIYFQF